MSFNEDEADDVYDEGGVKLKNPNIELMDQDILYHLALGNESHDLVEMFGDVKFVCMGGTPKRMEKFAYYIMDEIGFKLPTGTCLQDISRFSYRYAMFKVGPVLSISHGMGVPSVSILLHEIIKLMYHAKVKDPIFFRIGTCGGIGVEPGSVVISEEAVDELLKPFYEVAVLGKIVKRPALLNKRLIRELKALATPEDPYAIVTGKTMCSNDFYEGQARMDGAFCDFSEIEKLEYLERLQKNSVVNIEMECLALAALTYHAGIKCAIVCVAYLDRLKHDQIHHPKEVLEEWQQRPQVLVARYIKRYLQKKGASLFDVNHSYSHLCSSVCVKSPRRLKLVQQESESYD
ncbi:uridine phosphorylase 1-like [Planococcus citri]|uniref:uridine phosphorylase 1-like n=1 Tax=Planococcus citri TaxID=170843 RepID=UPI0031FA1B25